VYSLTRFTGFKPSLVGKLNTFIELGAIVVFLFFNVIGRLTVLLPACYVIVTASVVVSGLMYVVEGARIIKRHGS
jgi:phosphatidylglycerophosphate synthase